MNKNIEIIEFKNYNIGIFQNILLANQEKSPGGALALPGAAFLQ